MTVPRILLVTNALPDPSHGVTGVILSDICSFYPKERISLCYIKGNTEIAWASDIDDMPRVLIIRPSETGFKRWGKWFARHSRWLYERYIGYWRIPRVVQQIVEFGKAQKVELVWAPLNSPTVIRVAKKISEILRVPLVTTVWDPPQYKLPMFGLQGRTLKEYLSLFDSTIKASTRCAVMSEEMKQIYEQLYGVKCVILNHGFHEKFWQDVTPESQEQGAFVIGYAGSFYAEKGWNAFLSALTSVGWELAGRKVTVKILSNRFDVRLNAPVHIEYLGWQPIQQTLKMMSEVDVCYLPYWIEDSSGEAARLAFPTKLSLYLASGRPVFFNGPDNSSPVSFFKRFPVGLCCSSLNSDDIVRSLERLVTDRHFVLNALSARNAALRQELGLHIFRRRFAEFVGVKESDLLTL